MVDMLIKSREEDDETVNLLREYQNPNSPMA